jgi:predicted TIM-barrel fold metal-dependent hydrolase
VVKEERMLVDFHYHFADDKNALKELLADMDHSGVEWTLLMGGPPDAYWEYKRCRFAANERVLEAVKAHKDRLLGNVYIDPRDSDALGTLERYLQEDFRAVKMFPPVGFFPDEERFSPLYERIAAAGLPILVHTGQTNIKILSDDPKVRKATDSRYAHPMHLDKLSRLYPEIPFVMAHSGYPHFVEAWSVAHANTNVYLDISGSGPWTDGIPLVYNAIGGQNCIPIDFARVVWGSDNCLPQGEHIARMATYMRQMGAGSEQRELIFGDTARKLLKIA